MIINLVIVETCHECHHCPHIHPELCAVSPPARGDNCDRPGAWVGGAIDLCEGAGTMSLDGRPVSRSSNCCGGMRFTDGSLGGDQLHDADSVLRVFAEG